jgi:DNA-binding NarL/FixJ family response regulator
MSLDRFRRHPFGATKEDQMTRKHVFIAIAAGLFTALFVLEQIGATDPFNWVNFAKDMAEMGLLVGAVAMTGFVSAETRDLRLDRLELTEELAAARRDSARWRATARAHVSGLSRAIAEQFALWGLTEAEADVAGLMLKGLSHKEIAALRQGAEATVRQHATMVYRKSGLTSRAQLTGFFLEDLLSPTDPVPLSPSVHLVQPKVQS